jgi:uncharacterized membrane protein YccC
VSGLYDALARAAREKADGIDERRSYAVAIRGAWRALLLVPARRRAHIADLLGLLAEGERIAGELHALRVGTPGTRKAADRLGVIASAIRTAVPPSEPPPPADSAPLGESIAVAWRLASRSPCGAARAAHDPLGFMADLRATLNRSVVTVRAQWHWQSPVFRHAVRLAVAATLAEWVGRSAGDWGRIGIAGHGFWMCLTAALVLFPDYAGTVGRGVARTAGTLVGAVAGWGLTQAPTGPLAHAAILCGLLFGYLAFRSSGQLWLIVWIVAWISYLLGGGSAFTRTVDTIAGAAIALVVYLAWPTWHRDRLPATFAAWAHAQGSTLAATATAWTAPASVDEASLALQRRATRDARVAFAETAEHALHEPARHHVVFDEPVGDLLTLVHDVSRYSSVLASLTPNEAARACPSAAAYADYFEDVLEYVANAAMTGQAPADEVTVPVAGLCGPGDNKVAAAALARTVEATEALAGFARRYAPPGPGSSATPSPPPAR